MAQVRRPLSPAWFATATLSAANFYARQIEIKVIPPELVSCFLAEDSGLTYGYAY